MRRTEKLEAKRAEAKVRQENWDSLTPEQKLADLDRRLGKDQGAKKQRAKIAQAIADAKKPKKGEKVEKPEKAEKKDKDK